MKPFEGSASALRVHRFGWGSVALLSLCLMACDTDELGAQATGAVQVEEAFPELSFTRPVDLQTPGDGSGRLFVVEQAGRIRVFENDPEVEDADVFLDIRARVNDGGNEEGLLGLAFHPDFERNGYFYVDYTASNPRRTVISRFSVDPANADRADPGSEQVLLEIPQPYSNHNGGQVSFGPDGYLYIAMGDGGSGGDPQGHGQNLGTLLGTILRIDVDDPSGGRAYGIPADNPFAQATNGARPEIYAYGLRNPWRFSFDAETGTLWTGDVGQNRYEEVDIIEKGGNYGWNIREAAHCYDASSCTTAGLIDPIWEYGHGEGISITGGFVYRGTDVPDLNGKYVYADFGTGRVWALSSQGTEAVKNELLLDSDLSIASFGVDAENELYLTSFNGKLYRFTQASGVGAEVREASKRTVLGAGIPNTAHFMRR